MALPLQPHRRNFIY